jgi:hypothetical protein
MKHESRRVGYNLEAHVTFNALIYLQELANITNSNLQPTINGIPCYRISAGAHHLHLVLSQEYVELYLASIILLRGLVLTQIDNFTMSLYLYIICKVSNTTSKFCTVVLFVIFITQKQILHMKIIGTFLSISIQIFTGLTEIDHVLWRNFDLGYGVRKTVSCFM